MRFFSALLLLCLLPVTSYGQQLASFNSGGLTYGHVHLNVSDMERHKDIWVNHFGGRLVEKGRNAEGRPLLTAIVLNNMLVALSPSDPSMPSNETVMDHFGFKVRNMDTFLAKWEADGLDVSTEAAGFGGRTFLGAEGQINAFVDLPGGARVELQEDQGLQEEVTGYHIHFNTPGHEDLLAWYTDIFDLEVRPRGRIGTTTNVPGMNLSFGGSEAERAATQGTAIDHIGFEIDGLEEFCRRLEAKGIEFQVAYREIPAIDLNIAYIIDPRGVRIEFTEGYDEY
ncbi:MAG: VOC family protein [Pseudohongiellaceae bacterium]|jgi:catechol 2,3-dioxygenase-like lactoylglutathione lyase family enzyme